MVNKAKTRAKAKEQGGEPTNADIMYLIGETLLLEINEQAEIEYSEINEQAEIEYSEINEQTEIKCENVNCLKFLMQNGKRIIVSITSES